MNHIPLNSRALKLSSNAVELAEAILFSLKNNETVIVDFSAVEMITPSFSNALIMSLLEQFNIDLLRSSCEFTNRSDFVIATMNRSVVRYQNGARLLPKRAVAS